MVSTKFSFSKHDCAKTFRRLKVQHQVTKLSVPRQNTEYTLYETGRRVQPFFQVLPDFKSDFISANSSVDVC